jgi:ATP-dependent DNA helicase DinG
VLQF